MTAVFFAVHHADDGMSGNVSSVDPVLMSKLPEEVGDANLFLMNHVIIY